MTTLDALIVAAGHVTQALETLVPQGNVPTTTALQVNGLGPIFIQTADRAVTSSGTLFGTGVGGLLIGEAVLAPGATVRVTMAGRLNGASPALQLRLGGVTLASATSSVSGSGTGWRTWCACRSPTFTRRESQDYEVVV